MSTHDRSAAESPVAAPTVKIRARQPEEVKSRIIAAARNAFSNYGFEGASLREIARNAHVSLSLLLYHFQNKDSLWRAVIDDIMTNSLSTAGFIANNRQSTADNAGEQLRLLIARLVRAFADSPDIHRLIVMEAYRPSDRLVWLCDQFLKADFDAFTALIVKAQKEGSVRNLNAARLRYAIISLAAVPFSISAEYQYLTGHNPFSSREIDSAVEFIHRLVFADP